MSPIDRPAIPVDGSLRRAVAASIEAAVDLGRIHVPALDVLRRAAEDAARSVRQLDGDTRALRPPSDATRQMRHTFDEHNRAISVHGEAPARHLGEHGWTVPLWTTASFVVVLQAEFSADELDDVFVELYRSSPDEPLQMMFREIRSTPSLSHWQPLIRQAIAAFNRRQYRIVVPALLLIYEGAVARAVSEFERASDAKRAAARMVKREPPGITRLLWVSLLAFNEEVLRTHRFSDPRPLRINRHWIMHGRDRPEWTRADCL